MSARPTGSTSGWAWRSTASPAIPRWPRSEEHTSELQSPYDLVCRLLLEKKKMTINCARLRRKPRGAHLLPLRPRQVVQPAAVVHLSELCALSIVLATDCMEPRPLIATHL